MAQLQHTSNFCAFEDLQISVNMSSSTLSFCTFPILCIFIVVNLSFSFLYIAFRLTQASTCPNQGPLMSAKTIKPDQVPPMYVIFYKVHPKKTPKQKKALLERRRLLHCQTNDLFSAINIIQSLTLVSIIALIIISFDSS